LLLSTGWFQERT